MAPVHWDDATESCFGLDPLRGWVSHLGGLAGSLEIGVSRGRPEPSRP